MTAARPRGPRSVERAGAERPEHTRMAVDHRHVDQLEALEACMASHRVQARGGEAPVHEVVMGIDLSRRGDVNRRGIESPIRRPVGLEQHPSAGREAPSNDLQQPQRVLHPVQDPEAEDEVERLPELVQIECVDALVVDLGVEYLPDRGEPLPLWLNSRAIRSRSTKVPAPARKRDNSSRYGRRAD